MISRADPSRRGFLALLGAAFSPRSSRAAETTGKGRTFPAALKRYADPTTEIPLVRITDPAHTSLLPPAYARPISRRGNFLLYASDVTGRFEAFRMDLKSGQSRQLTEAMDLDPRLLALDPNDRGLFYFDGNQLIFANISNLRSRVIYEIPSGFVRGRGLSVSEDGQYAAIVEKKDERHRLQWIRVANGEAKLLADCGEEIRDPVPRPRRASILYFRSGGLWLANDDASQNYRLRLAGGETGPALWSPDGRDVLYLNYPADQHKLHNLREFTPDSNEDRAISDTSQFVAFDRNGDATVFVGASGSKASPYVLLLVRAVKRELTLAEHRSSDSTLVAPQFAPTSQRIFFGSDQHGKPAIYTMAVDKFVAETGEN
jgi:oligogalacturonide lyase